MKKLLVIALIAIFAVGFAVEGFAINPSGPNMPGDLMGNNGNRRASDPQRTFRLVRWAPLAAEGNVALTADTIVVWETTTYGDGVTITTTATSGDSRVAGVIRTAIASGDPTGAVRLASDDVGRINWGWLQTYGLAQVNVNSSTGRPVVGYAFGAANSRGSAGVFSADNMMVQTSTAANMGKAGFFMQSAISASPTFASTADENLKCFIMCE